MPEDPAQERKPECHTESLLFRLCRRFTSAKLRCDVDFGDDLR